MHTFIGTKTKREIVANTSDDFIAINPITHEVVKQTLEQIFQDSVDKFWDALCQTHVTNDQGASCLRLFTVHHLLPPAPIKAIGKQLGFKEQEAKKILRNICHLRIDEQQRIAAQLYVDRTAHLLGSSGVRKVVWWRVIIDYLIDATAAIPTTDLLPLLLLQIRSPAKWILSSDKPTIPKITSCRTHLSRAIGIFVRQGLLYAPAIRSVLSSKGGKVITEGGGEACLAAYQEEISRDGAENHRLNLIQRLTHETSSTYGEEHARKARRILIHFLAYCDARELGDLSTDLINSFASLYHVSADASSSPVLAGVKKEIKYLHTALSRALKAEWPDQHFAFHVPNKRKVNPFRRDDSFSWLDAHPQLFAWQDLARRYVKALSAGYVSAQVMPLNLLFDFFLKRAEQGLEIPLEPNSIEPAAHIFAEDGEEAYTLWGYMQSLKSKRDPDEDVGAAHKTRHANAISNFFDWIAKVDGQFKNPIDKRDFRFASRMNLGRTSRIALDSVIVDTMKELLVKFERDANGKIISVEFPLAALFHPRPHRVFDTKAHQWTEVVWPIPSILLYLLASVPLRSFQARWLDSGIMDRVIYDATSQSFIENPADHIRDRQAGVICQVFDPATGHVFPGMRINTNKVEDPTAPQVGYTVPYISDELLFLLSFARDWQVRYHSAGATSYSSPIQLYDHDGRKINPKLKSKMPIFYPLFRAIDAGPSHVQPYGRVVSYLVVRTSFSYLMGVVETRLQEKHRLPRTLVEWDTREDGTKTVARSLVDLHSLRATGITRLYDLGVPIDIIARFVSGHLTVLMTLYYINHGPMKLREVLSREKNSFAEKAYSDAGLPNFMSEEANKFLLSNSNFDQSRSASAIEASIRTNIHHLTDGASGVCPGTMCSEGGLDSQGRPMMVRGGSGACGCCRFWRTSYLFLNGQVARLNEIAYECHVLSREILEARKNARKLGLEVERDPENHRNKVFLHQHESQLKGLEEALDDKLYDYAGRYELFKKSEAQYVELHGTSDKTEPELGNALSETSPYIHAHWLSLQAEVAPELGVCSRAIVDLENAIMYLCDTNQLPNFLLRLEKDARLKAANAFVEALSETDTIARASPDVINGLFEGRVLLSEVGLQDTATSAIRKVVVHQLPYEASLNPGANLLEAK